MRVAIPAICENALCRTIWFKSSLIEMPNGVSSQISASKVRPCPICGGWGDIPDGVYTTESATIFRRDQFDAIFNAITQLREKIEKGATKDEIEKEIAENPALAYLKGFIPADLKDLAVAIGILWAIIAICRQEKPPAAIQMNRDLHQILKSVSAEQPASPISTPVAKTVSGTSMDKMPVFFIRTSEAEAYFLPESSQHIVAFFTSARAAEQFLKDAGQKEAKVESIASGKELLHMLEGLPTSVPHYAVDPVVGEVASPKSVSTLISKLKEAAKY